MHYDLIILTDRPVPSSLFEGINHLVISQERFLVDLYHLDDGNSFDYLIFSNIDAVSCIDVLIDFEAVVTNNNFQTSHDHIFAIGPINNSKTRISDQWSIIADFLKYNE